MLDPTFLKIAFERFKLFFMLRLTCFKLSFERFNLFLAA